jgi:hypothetical protein
MVEIGFVVLSHDSPGRLLRLVRTLSTLYEDPPIVCHHNFSLCALDANCFPDNVRFVDPHVDARWGDISLVQAGLTGIRLLLEKNWDWFFFMSGSDYPICDATVVRTALSKADYDALIDIRPAKWIKHSADGPDSKGEYSFSRPHWPALAYERSLTHRISIPSLTKRLRPCLRSIRVRNPKLLRLLGKWPAFTLYGGDQWFGGNRQTAEQLVNHPKLREILDFLKPKELVEEIAYQTLIGNSELSYSAYKRFSKWPANVAHPKWLGLEDLDDMINSGSWFARKFLPDDPVLDSLDAHLKISCHSVATRSPQNTQRP